MCNKGGLCETFRDAPFYHGDGMFKQFEEMEKKVDTP